VDFSNSRRAQFRKIYPNATNGQLSSILAKEWKEASSDVKAEYIEREARLREQYKIDLAAWEAANKGNVEGGSAEGDDDDGDDDDDNQEEEEDRKPRAIDRKSKRHEQESIDIDESRKAARSEITLPAGGASRQHPAGRDSRFLDSWQVPGSSHQQQLAVSKYARLPGSHEEQEATSVDQQQVLEPLISTDIGGFLAAAAALSASSEDGSSPTGATRQAPPHPTTTTDATSPSSAMGMNNAGVREVVSQLPHESVNDADLPKTPSD
jgi:HMG (high mobility group) box